MKYIKWFKDGMFLQSTEIIKLNERKSVAVLSSNRRGEGGTPTCQPRGLVTIGRNQSLNIRRVSVKVRNHEYRNSALCGVLKGEN